jgi:hypothetical protein
VREFVHASSLVRRWRSSLELLDELIQRLDFFFGEHRAERGVWTVTLRETLSVRFPQRPNMRVAALVSNLAAAIALSMIESFAKMLGHVGRPQRMSAIPTGEFYEQPGA